LTAMALLPNRLAPVLVPARFFPRLEVPPYARRLRFFFREDG
jgi:hypothetical protein